MTRTEVRGGQRLSTRAWALIEDAAQAVGIQPGVVYVSQGGYKGGTGAGASAGTHDKGDVFDLRIWNLPASVIEPLVVELRRRNGCAWLRDPQHGPWTSTGPHIHCVLRDSADGLSDGAKQQVRDYDDGLNGLANRQRDYHPRPPQSHWEADDMPLTDADVERIAEAVWKRVVSVDGVDRKMGAMAVATFKAAQAMLPSGAADEPA